MSKFGALAANVGEAFRVVLIDAVTDKPIKTSDGKTEAFVEVYSSDSAKGREFDTERGKQITRRAIRGRDADSDDDGFAVNVAKLARLMKAWVLVDPETGAVIDVPCNEQNAIELFSEPGMGWLFRQVWLGANEPANFIKRSSKTLSPLPSKSSAATAG